MFSIFAFIGLCTVLWAIRKGLLAFGNWAIRTSNEMADYTATISKKKADYYKSLRQQNIKAANEVRNIKGADSDSTYKEQVKKEIEDITAPKPGL